MASQDSPDLRWLTGALALHSRLAPAVASLLENLLKQSRIDFLSVTCRVKEKNGVEEKIKRKEYSDPEHQLTDISGIRIITYFAQQVSAIAPLIRSTFDVDGENSLDITDSLGTDRIGYRSVHFVCTFGKDRRDLPEYKTFGGLKFEIQVRTVLQHAWAELAHDRSYKFGLELPGPIQRKLNLYAGMLELVDGGFDEISLQIDEYRESIAKATKAQLSEKLIDSINVEEFAKKYSSLHGLDLKNVEVKGTLFRELRDFGITTIGDLERLCTDQFFEALKAADTDGMTLTGMLRRLMLYTDIDRYAEVKPAFSALSKPSADLIRAKYGSKKLAAFNRRLRLP